MVGFRSSSSAAAGEDHIVLLIIIFFLGKKSSLGVVYVVIPLFLLSIVYKNGLNRYPFILYTIPDIINVLLHYKYIIVLYNISIYLDD